jgi:LETM1 and EF-hand domain-containing protein 1
MYRTINAAAHTTSVRTNAVYIPLTRRRLIQPDIVARILLVRPSAAAQRGLYTNRQIMLRSEPKLATKVVSSEEKETMTSRAALLAKEQAAKAAAAGETAPAPVIKPKKTLWQKVKEEAVHYWHGTQLLGLEIRISSKLTWKLLNGGNLTRREHRQVSFI